MTNKIKAVIFDMDGVLIDAQDWHYKALNDALEIFGLTISRADHLITFDGLSTGQKLNMLSSLHGLPRQLHSFINEMKQQYTMDITYQLCKPTFHHQYALARLKKENYQLVVASNSIKNTIKTMMEKSNLLEYLDFYLSNQDVSRPKPNPEIYELAISRLGYEARECVIVEDSETGYKAAKASGANVFRVASVNDVTYINIKNFINKVESND